MPRTQYTDDVRRAIRFVERSGYTAVALMMWEQLTAYHDIALEDAYDLLDGLEKRMPAGGHKDLANRYLACFSLRVDGIASLSGAGERMIGANMRGRFAIAVADPAATLEPANA